MIPAPIRVAALAAFLSSPAWAQEAPAPDEGVNVRLSVEDGGVKVTTEPPPTEMEELQAEMKRLQAEMDSLRAQLQVEKSRDQDGFEELIEGLEALERLEDLEELEQAGGVPPTPPIPEVPSVEAIPPIPPLPPIPPEGLEDRVGYGKTVHVRAGEMVNDVASFGGPVVVEGHVLGDVAAFGGPIDIRPGGIVEGDAQSFGGSVYVADGAELHGDRINFAGSEPGILAIDEEEHEVQPSFARRIYNKIVFLLSLAGAGVLVVGLFPQRVAKVAEDIGQHPIRSAVVGTLGSIVISAVGLLFAITILGLPMSFVLFGLLGIAWLLGFVALCQAVGDKLPFEQKPHGRWIAFLVGVLLVGFVGALPFVGWLTIVGISVIGIGAALSTKFGVASPA